MKTKEFIERMQSRKLKVFKNDFWTRVETSDGVFVITSIDEKYSSVLDTNYPGMKEINPTTRKELVELFIDYANTPIDERKEDKRYTLRFIHLEEYEYLTLCTARGENKIEFGEEQNNDFYQTQFTNDEIDGLPSWVFTMIDQGHIAKEAVEQ